VKTDTKPFKTLNKGLLLRIKEKVLAEPEKFHMANWAVVDGDRAAARYIDALVRD
jgi:hypothetical protein